MKLFKNKKLTKGSRQVKMNLEGKFSIIYSRKKIQRIMRKYGIYCTIRRPNPYKRIAKATAEHSVAPNILQRGFKTEEEKSTYFYPFLKNFDYIDLINRYEVIKKDLEVDKKEVILNMFIISTKLIEKLKKVDFKFNSMKQKNKKR